MKKISQITHDSLPILDLRAFYNLETRASFLNELQYIARHVGFFYLIGHGLDTQRIQEILSYTHQFFELEQQEKDHLAITNSPHFRGYTKVNGELTQNKPDIREQIDIGAEQKEIPFTANTPMWTRLQGPNQWPHQWPDFRQVVETWLSDNQRISIDLLHAFLLALGVDEKSLDPFVLKNPNVSLKLIHYPKVSSQTEPQGVGAHKDTNILTLLLQDDTGGLQVQLNDHWVDIPYVENAFIINIGETLELATNGYLIANKHRVISPQNKDRYSVAYFISPNIFAGNIPILDLPQHLKNLAKGPTSDPKNPLLIDVAENNMKSRLRSHLDVTKKFYPNLYTTLNHAQGGIYEKQ